MSASGFSESLSRHSSRRCVSPALAFTATSGRSLIWTQRCRCHAGGVRVLVVEDEDADPFTNAVRVTMVGLRRKLGEPALVETPHGAGYLATSPHDIFQHGEGLDGAPSPGALHHSLLQPATLTLPTVTEFRSPRSERRRAVHRRAALRPSRPA
ncbi:MAG: hypothetical protein GEU96_17130 [Propionibacteriales bacterium]|nr:hypothetical protein [Propionibacteriales bacterium]